MTTGFESILCIGRDERPGKQVAAEGTGSGWNHVPESIHSQRLHEVLFCDIRK